MILRVECLQELARLHQLAISGKAHEDREVKLVEDFGGAIPALAAHLDNSTYEAFVMVVPGKQLAAIYDRWGPRLLEQNVRSFLQARGSDPFQIFPQHLLFSSILS